METSTKTYSVIAVVLLLVCIIGGYVLYSNFWPTYSQAQLSYKQTQIENAQLKATVASVETFVKSFEQQKDKVQTTNLALPARDVDMANFTFNLSQLATQSGVVLGALQIQSDDKDTTDNAITIQNLGLAVSGTYGAFQDFMKRLEANLRIIDTNNVIISVPDSSNPVMSFQLKMRIYYQK